jgi:hypothetical protein
MMKRRFETVSAMIPGRGHVILLVVSALMLAQPQRLPAQGSSAFDPVRLERALKGQYRLTLEADYGVLSPGHRTISAGIVPLGAVEVKWGFSQLQPATQTIGRFEEKFAFGSLMDPRYAPEHLRSGEIGGKAWQLGIGVRDGYGYWPGKILILPYALWSFTWTKWFPEYGQPVSAADSSIIERYDRRVNFGLSAEAGLSIQFGWNVALVAGYDFGFLYTRYVFPQWLASFGLAATTQGVLGLITAGLVKDAPSLAPILNALLKGGAAYAFYLAYRDNQYWPIPSETPLTYQGFKIGLSVRF